MGGQYHIFLSTLPARGATTLESLTEDISDISIHTPREGSDRSSHQTPPKSGKFLSTLPARGATRHLAAKLDALQISIHTPREGSDVVILGRITTHNAFLSTLPARGATYHGGKDAPRDAIFLSTLPARGAIVSFKTLWLPVAYFYPHSPRGERPSSSRRNTPPSLFLSTLPARGATSAALK